MGSTLENREQLDLALRQLCKLIKGVGFYPSGHPALEAILGEGMKAFSPLLDGVHLAFTIRKGGILLDGQPVGENNSLLRNLATILFARRLQQILLLPEFSAHDLMTFVRCLTLDPAVLQTQGGIQALLHRAGVTTVWINNIDIRQILEEKKRLDSLPATQREEERRQAEALLRGEAAEPQEKERQNLATLLRRLRKETSDAGYRRLLQEIVPLAAGHLNEAGHPEALEALALLAGQTGAAESTPSRREYAQKALEALDGKGAITFLVDTLRLGSLDQGRRREALQGLAFFGEKAARPLMESLTREKDVQARKQLTQGLVQLREGALPVLFEFLGDERWYVIRNAAFILGEIRHAQALERLPQLLGHEDVRVRREAIRAITRIGGRHAVGILLGIVQGEVQEMRRQALLALGAMKDPAAVPFLLKLIQRRDFWGREEELKKEAIRALGEIGSPAAIPGLTAALLQRRLWRRSRHDEVRAVAAWALGEIGSLEGVPALETAVDDRSGKVARLAAQALKQIQRGRIHAD